MDDADHELKQAISCLDNGQYELALCKLAAGTADETRRAISHYFRAVAHRAMCDGVSATADYLQAVALSRITQIPRLKEKMQWGLHDATGFFNRGCAYHIEGDLDSAINNYSEALKLERDQAATLLNRGCAFKARDRNNPASPLHDERYGGRPDCYRAENDFIAVLRCAAGHTFHAIARQELAGLRFAPGRRTK